MTYIYSPIISYTKQEWTRYYKKQNLTSEQNASLLLTSDRCGADGMQNVL